MELVLKSERQEAMDQIKAEYPNLIMIDYTLPQSVNGELYGSLSKGCCSMHQAAGRCPNALQHTMSGEALFMSVLDNMLCCSVCAVRRCLSNMVSECTGLFETCSAAVCG